MNPNKYNKDCTKDESTPKIRPSETKSFIDGGRVSLYPEALSRAQNEMRDARKKEERTYAKSKLLHKPRHWAARKHQISLHFPQVLFHFLLHQTHDFCAHTTAKCPRKNNTWND